MRNSGIKAYFAQREALEVDPKAVDAYQASISTVVPTITRKLRESDQFAAELRISKAAPSRAKASAKARKKLPASS